MFIHNSIGELSSTKPRKDFGIEMDSYDVLVIILSIALAVFLTLAIIATVMIIQILKKVKTVSEAAQATVDNVEEFTSNLRNAGKVTAVGSVVNQVVNLFKKGSK